MVKVKLYVEGGGEQAITLSECRRGFSEFIRKVLPPKTQPKIIACGSRNDAFDSFSRALATKADEVVLLLVDAEDPIGPASPWVHLASRDGWKKPDTATDENVYLMVLAMEAWLVADPEALATFYGQGFDAGALPRRQNLEEEPKTDVLKALIAATRHTKTKGPYHKTRHGFALLAACEPSKVRSRSSHAERFCANLLRIVQR